MLSRLRGKNAEHRAKKFLQQKGITILVENFRFKRCEIDLIGHDKDFLIFFEVKFRSQDYFGACQEMLRPKQSQRIMLAAQQFLLKYPRWQAFDFRFDLITITPHLGIQWYQQALDGRNLG